MSLTPKEIPTGAVRFNTDSSKVEVYIGSTWMEVAVSSPNLDGGARGVFHSGRTSSGNDVNTIDFITISTAGNAVDFGDSTQANESQNIGVVSSRTRGLNGGGYSSSSLQNEIGFLTIATTGTHSDFGNLQSARRMAQSLSSATRGIFAGGLIDPNGQNTIDFVTITSTGDGVDFGDLIQNRASGTGMASPTRGLIIDGYLHPSVVANTFITIATLGNAQEFGDSFDSSTNRYGMMGISNSIRGIVGGGVTGSPGSITKYIESYQIATLGKGTNFGDLVATTRSTGGIASPTRGVFAGGRAPADSDSSPSGPVDFIQYVSMQTESDTVDFGDLTQGRYEISSMGNAHGGL